MASMGSLGMIGVGNMGSALLRGVLKNGLFEAGSVWIADMDEVKTSALAEELGVGVAASNIDVLAHADTVILAVKPQGMAGLMTELAPHATSGHLFISIAAGITSSLAERLMGPETRFIRVMPNTPSMLGYGAAGVARGARATAGDVEKSLEIFSAVGMAVEVEESQINSVTGLSGSGPAYIFYLVEALTQAGEEVGLEPDVAARLSRQTVLGAAMMMAQPGADPADLRRKVTSPKGTTEAGLKILEEGGFPALIERTVARAAERGEELGKLFE